MGHVASKEWTVDLHALPCVGVSYSARNFVTFSGLGLDLEENMAILQVDMVKLRWFFQKAFIARPACMARLHPKASDWLV